MRSYFDNKVNYKTRDEYIKENIKEAESVFTLSDKDLEEIADGVIKELDDYFGSALCQEITIKNSTEELYSLGLYLRDINCFKVIGFRDSIALARASELGNDEARNHLICAHLKWAFRIASRFHKSFMVDLLDLAQQANLGLVDAVDRWEKARVKGADFKTYARHRVVGEILDFLRGDGKLIGQPPHSIKELKKKIEWITEHWTKGETPTPVELAKLCGASRALVISAVLFRENAIDEKIEEILDSGENLEDNIASCIDAENSLRAVRQAIEKFSAQHNNKRKCQKILFLRLGFTEEMKLKEIGKKFGLTESRICQIMKDFFIYLRFIKINETTSSILAKQKFVAERRERV